MVEVKETRTRLNLSDVANLRSRVLFKFHKIYETLGGENHTGIRKLCKELTGKETGGDTVRYGSNFDMNFAARN